MRTDNKLFNPASQPKELLIENFVVRTKVFEKIFKDIQSGKMKYPEQHYLIQGLRGMGKTTLLLRLKYEVEKSEALNNWLIPVFFNEESYDLSSLSNLWEKLLKYLDEYFETGGKLYDTTEKFMGSKDYEKQCLDFLLQTLHERKKKLLILFDNFGELFLDNLSEKETHRLREVLMNCSDIRIVAASAIVLEDQHDYSKPFFEFFKIIYLDGLNKEETLDLITKLQEKETGKKINIEKNKAKIETLALLTGGVIRTILLLYEVLLSDENGTALRDLDIILDRITPLYKHRMEVLSVQQRKIVDVVAKSWDATSVKEIAGKIRENGNLMQGKAISAQLAQLEKNNVIEKKETTTKNNFYQLKERFFNIWYLMRNGNRHDKCRVIWLTKFLEMWYSDEQEGMKGFINTHINRLQKGNYYHGAALLIVEAIFNSEKISFSEKKKVLKETEKILPKNLLAQLPKIEENLLREPQNFINPEVYKKIQALAKNKVINQVDFILGSELLITKQYEKAIVYFEKLRKESVNDFIYFEAIILESLNKIEEAINLFFKDFDNKDSFTQKLSASKLAAHFFQKKMEKEKALKAAYEMERTGSTEKVAFTLILLWNNKIEDAFEYSLEILENKEKQYPLIFIDGILRFFLIKKQYHLVLNLFNDPKYELKDKYKPLYYALMHFMKDEYPNEYLKMGSELEPAVKDIIANINQLAIDYA